MTVLLLALAGGLVLGLAVLFAWALAEHMEREDEGREE